MISLKDRKKLRQARKKITYERRREKLKCANRRPKYIFFLALAGLCVTNAIVCASALIRIYGEYRYETRVSRLDLPSLSAPCCLKIAINYQGSPPEIIGIFENDTSVPRDLVIITNDPADSAISVIFDTDVNRQGLYLSVRPMDNLELEYKTSVEPSYRYMDARAEFYSDSDGDLWTDVMASYPRNQENVSCEIRSRGPHPVPLIFKSEIPQNIRYPLDISKIIRAYKNDRTGIDEVLITFEAENAEPVEISIKISDWPGYDPDRNTPGSYAISNTDKYISGL